jgi:ATP-dependent protease ClpP protease subunit
MNRQRVEQLLCDIRGRVHNLASPDKAAPNEGFRATNEAGTTVLYIYDRIGGWWEGVFAKDVASALVGAGDVEVHINSGGGDIFEGAAIHNLFKNHSGKVTMRIDGVAASAASFIAMAGDTIVMEPNATMMVHEGSAICVGGAKDMRDSADVLDLLNKTIAGMYASRAGGTVDEWLGTMGEETWYDAEKALAAGLVDEVAPAKAKDAAAPTDGFDMSVFDLLTKAAVAETTTAAAAQTDTPEPALVTPQLVLAAAGAPAPVATSAATSAAEASSSTTTTDAPNADGGLGFADLLWKELAS